VKRHVYRERDYAFARLVLTLRTNIGLTQAGLAARLGISRRAVAEWEAGSRRGEVRVWEAAGQTLHRVWQAHTDYIYALAFSPDGHTLASGSWDCAIKLWDLKSGTLLWTERRTNSIQSLAFAPDGRKLASG
jgi:WD40 repeat protein